MCQKPLLTSGLRSAGVCLRDHIGRSSFWHLDRLTLSLKPPVDPIAPGPPQEFLEDLFLACCPLGIKYYVHKPSGYSSSHPLTQCSVYFHTLLWFNTYDMYGDRALTTLPALVCYTLMLLLRFEFIPRSSRSTPSQLQPLDLSRPPISPFRLLHPRP